MFGSSQDLEKILGLLGIDDIKIGYLFKILAATKEKDLINGIVLLINSGKEQK